jgi:pyrroline-5-carboxylate reductase
VEWHTSADTLPDDLAPDAVVFAVKPQIIDAVLPSYRRWVRPETLFVSIVAGKTSAGLGRHLGPAALIRTMPNTPAAIGRGITVACANARVTQQQRQLCDRLLAAIGENAWVEDEALIDAVTAVSGAGAYVFLLISGGRAGKAQDCRQPWPAARPQHRGGSRTGPRLCREPSDLRENVTSPGGYPDPGIGRPDGEPLTADRPIADDATALLGELIWAQRRTVLWRRPLPEADDAETPALGHRVTPTGSSMQPLPTWRAMVGDIYRSRRSRIRPRCQSCGSTGPSGRNRQSSALYRRIHARQPSRNYRQPAVRAPA